jgi:DNA modification methylase
VTVRLLNGDAIEVLRTLPADSVDCCVTSPPYWGLRDYGVTGQIGLEPTPAAHIAVMVAVFEEVRRVLKPHGSLWLNYGDCYATAPNGRSAAKTKAAGNDDRTFRDKPFSTVGGGLKPKDLCMLPNRLAIALQDAGWWVRSEIIWGKPNAMPDSGGTARPLTAHEKIFLLTKSGDADVWRARDTGEISFAPDLTERCPLATRPDETAARWTRMGSYYDAGAVMMTARGDGTGPSVGGWAAGDVVHTPIAHNQPGRSSKNKPRGKSPPAVTPRHEGAINHTGLAEAPTGAGRLLRNFEPDLSELVPPGIMAWEIAIAGFSGAHFATFPPALVVPCILAGCPATVDNGDGTTRPGTVLDPFGGAGTTGMVADALGRDAILIELNHDYAQMARDRLRTALCRVESDLPEAEAPRFGLFAQAARSRTWRRA